MGLGENSPTTPTSTPGSTTTTMSLILPAASNAPKLPQSLIFFISNIDALIPIKLTTTNFLVWKTLIEAALKANFLFEFVEGKISCPNQASEPDAFAEWITINGQLMSGMLSTIDHTVLPLLKNITAVSELWKTLINKFAVCTRSQIHTLQHKLHNLHKDTKTMTEYIDDIKSTLDQLSLSSVVIDDEQLIVLVLDGLSKIPEYDSIASQIRHHPNKLSIEQAFAMLKSEEIHVQRAQKLREAPSSTNVAFQVVHNTGNNNGYRGYSRGTYNNRGNRGNFRGNYRGGRTGGPRPRMSPNNGTSGEICQICGKGGHIARTCWFRFVTPESNQKTTGSSHAFSVTSDFSYEHNNVPNSSQDWYLDSGASHHITNNMNNLNINEGYSGGDQVYLTF